MTANRFDVCNIRQDVYRHDERKGKRGYIYVFRCEGFLKIGRAANVQSRLDGMATGCPFPITKVIARAVPLSTMNAAERWLHERFKDRRVRGEWFAITEDEARAAVLEAVNFAGVYYRRLQSEHGREKRTLYDQALADMAA